MQSKNIPCLWLFVTYYIRELSPSHTVDLAGRNTGLLPSMLFVSESDPKKPAPLPPTPRPFVPKLTAYTLDDVMQREERLRWEQSERERVAALPGQPTLQSPPKNFQQFAGMAAPPMSSDQPTPENKGVELGLWRALWNDFTEWVNFKNTLAWIEREARAMKAGWGLFSICAVLACAATSYVTYKIVGFVKLDNQSKPIAVLGDSISGPLKTPISVERKKAPPMLHDLFVSDLPDAAWSSQFGKVEILYDNGTNKVTVDVKLLMDPESNSEFISFYVPPEMEDAFSVCGAIADKVEKERLELSKFLIGAVMDSIDGSEHHFSDIKFTGAVYIYCDGPLQIEQIGDLRSLFRSKGLFLQVRDFRYLMAKTLLDKNKQPKE
jgi:hypothetical protein